jgi:hypothetical protein
MRAGCCPSCGQIIAPQNPFDGQPVKARIYDFIAKRSGGVTTEELMEHIYADDPDGGPDSPKAIAVHISRMNDVLIPLGLRIASSLGRGAVYRLWTVNEASGRMIYKRLTPALTQEIKDLYAVVKSHRKLADQLGISTGTVFRALHSKS